MNSDGLFWSFNPQEGSRAKTSSEGLQGDLWNQLYSDDGWILSHFKGCTWSESVLTSRSCGAGWSGVVALSSWFTFIMVQLTSGQPTCVGLIVFVPSSPFLFAIYGQLPPRAALPPHSPAQPPFLPSPSCAIVWELFVLIFYLAQFWVFLCCWAILIHLI